MASEEVEVSTTTSHLPQVSDKDTPLQDVQINGKLVRAVLPSPHGYSSINMSSSVEEWTYFSMGADFMLVKGDPAASSPPASYDID